MLPPVHTILVENSLKTKLETAVSRTVDDDASEVVDLDYSDPIQQEREFTTLTY